MASLLPNLSPPTAILQSIDKSIASPLLPSNSFPTIHYPLIKLEPPVIRVTLLHQPPPFARDELQRQQEDGNEFYVNLGLAIRTLREDLPLLFTKDLNYDIYRDDITFLDPLNKFTGIDNYKLIFWALRFHGRLFFREISLQVYRIWQPSEKVILIRWNVKGVPRVPWEAKGEFQGTSRYKLDRNGKIYEHKVDNLSFNFPQPLKPASQCWTWFLLSQLVPTLVSCLGQMKLISIRLHGLSSIRQSERH